MPSLDLKNMTLEEELEKYLREITKLSEPEIVEVMEVYHAHT